MISMDVGSPHYGDFFYGFQTMIGDFNIFQWFVLHAKPPTFCHSAPLSTSHGRQIHLLTKAQRWWILTDFTKTKTGSFHFISHDGSMVLVEKCWLGYIYHIDGIHGTPYIAAPWIRPGYSFKLSKRIKYNLARLLPDYLVNLRVRTGSAHRQINRHF